MLPRPSFRWLLLLAACLPAATLSLQTAEAAERTLRREVKLDDIRALHAKAGISVLRVIAADTETATAKVDIHCKAGTAAARCTRAAGRISLELTVRGSTLRAALKGATRLRARHVRIEYELRVPAQLVVETDTVAGDVRIAGMANHVEVDIGSGDARLQLPKEAVRVVELDVGVGSPELQVDGGKVAGAGLIGRGLTWRDGPGSAIVEVDIGAGDAIVSLE